MAKELVVSATTHETRVATLEDDKLVEISIERASEHALAGNIYKGRVSRVLPGMQSAFVKLGLERDAFLYVSDVLDKTEEIEAGSLDEDEDEVVTSAAQGRTADDSEDGGDTSDDDRRRGRGRRGRRRGRGRGRSESDRNRPDPDPDVARAAGERPDPDNRGAEEEEPGYRRRRRGRRRGRRAREDEADRPDRSERSERPDSDNDEPREGSADDDRSDPSLSVLPGESLAKYRGRDDPDDETDSGYDDEREEDQDEEYVYEEAEEEGEQDEDEEYEYEYVYEEEEVEEDDSDSTASDEYDNEEDTESDDEESTEEDDAEEQPDDGPDDEEPASDSDDDAPVEHSDEDQSDDDNERDAEEDSDDQQDAASDDGADEQVSARKSEDQHGAPGMPEPASGDEDEEQEDGDSREAADAEVRDRSESRGLRRGRRGRRRGGRGRRGRGDDGNGEPEETSGIEAGEPADAEQEESDGRHERSDRRGGRGDRRRSRSGRGDSGRSSSESGEAATLISDLLKPGQEVIVQIAKEPLGKKGARITSHIALPGRYLVYMPTTKHVGVSRKIHSDAERARLRRVIRDNMDGAPGGCIIRTAGQGATDDDLIADLKFLINIWKTVIEKAEKRQAPTMLHQDLDVVERILRDQLGQNFKTIWVDSEEEYERILQFVERFQPDLVSRVKLYTKTKPIFDEFGISTEIEKALRPKVWLKSGGYLVINQTEALVAIDINTGKYVGKSDRLEDTIVKTNLEAVQEIVRQMRLRDLGGIIVVDFIDMDDRQNRKKVMQALEKELRTDRAPSKALQFNDFGLVAITRKRVKQSLERTLCSPCPSCTGSGYVKSVPTMIFEILEDCRKAAANRKSQKDVTLRVHPDIARALKSRDNAYLQELEDIFRANVIVRGDLSLHRENFDIIS